jgi:hypothetical protein
VREEEGKSGCGKGRRDAGDSKKTMDEEKGSTAVSFHCYATRYGYRRKQSDKQSPGPVRKGTVYADGTMES